jgi:uncharacterized membrane protein
MADALFGARVTVDVDWSVGRPYFFVWLESVAEEEQTHHGLSCELREI